MLLTHDTAKSAPETIEADSPRPTPKRHKPARKMLTLAAAIFVAGTVAGVAIVESSGTASPDPTTQPAGRSGDDLVRDLAERGVIPSATLQSAPRSHEDLIQDLVARGLVPAATLQG